MQSVRFDVELSTSRSLNSSVLSIKQLKVLEPGKTATVVLKKASSSEKFTVVLRVERSAYTENLSSGGEVVVLEGSLDPNPEINGEIAVRFYPKSKRAILVPRD